MRSYVIEKARKFSFVLSDHEKFPYVKEFLLHFLEPRVMVISPFHPSDVINDFGHYHVYLKFDGLVPIDRVERIVHMLLAFHVSPVRNEKALIRYFCHADNPEKGVQFDPSEMFVYGDIDIMQYFNSGKC